MTYTPISSFRRAISAADLSRLKSGNAPEARPAPVNKWDVLRDLGTARKALGLSDRTLSVLQALLGFHPPKMLEIDKDTPVVFPSNAAICGRLNGMPCSTMRRHLAALVQTGLIARRDSPNGKRFVRRYGPEPQVFGFDLAPLIHRATEFQQRAEAARKAADELRQLRQTVSLMRRDLLALLAFDADRDARMNEKWEALTGEALALLRRRADRDQLAELEINLREALNDLSRPTEEMSTNDAQIEHQHQTSNEDENRMSETLVSERRDQSDHASDRFVLDHCPSVSELCETEDRGNGAVKRMGQSLRPMVGISTENWVAAIRDVGLHKATVVVCGIVEHIAFIKAPDRYFRRIVEKMAAGQVSAISFLTALKRRAEREKFTAVNFAV